MDPELPDVKVIAPEKELDPPDFQPTPVEPSQEETIQPEVTGVQSKPEADIPSVDAQVDVAAVMDGFGKIIEDTRASKNVNLNEPIDPPPLGQQLYERPQQFFDEEEADEEDYPFKLSGRFISYGVVIGEFSDGSTVNPPAFMYLSNSPYDIGSTYGYVYLSLTVHNYYKIIPSSININIDDQVPVDNHPRYYKVIGFRGLTTTMNFVRTALNFYVCGFRGIFS